MFLIQLMKIRAAYYLHRTRQGRFTLGDSTFSQTTSDAPKETAETGTSAATEGAADGAPAAAEEPSISTVEGAAQTAPPAAATTDATLEPSPTTVAIPWTIFERAIKGEDGPPDAEGWREWEREVMARMEVV